MVYVDGLPLSELRKRSSTKWRDFAPDVLPLPVAEMDFEIAEPIRALLLDLVQQSDTGYLGSIPELGEALATFTAKRWSWKIESEDIFLATDVGVGMVEMARTIVQPGDSILINSPVYHNFNNWIAELKCISVDAPLKRTGEDNLNYVLDLAAIERAYAEGIKIHFLCNPSNPTGTVFTKSELAELAELAKKYNVAIFSDEIHAPLTFAEPVFTPFLNVSETAREVGICVTSASKSWNLAGLKCAQIIVASENQLARAKSMPMAVHWRASLFGALAAAEAFKSVDWLDGALAAIDRNRKYLKELLTNNLPSVGYRIPDCSYLAWLDVSALNLGEDPAAIFLEKGKVAFNAGATFAPGSEGFVRLNFATSTQVLDEAVQRMVATTR